MASTYAAYTRRYRLRKWMLIVSLGGVVFWWKRSAARHSEDAWTASILEHLTAGATSREVQKEQMKQAFRLVEATNHQQKDMLDLYRQQAEELGLPPTKK